MREILKVVSINAVFFLAITIFFASTAMAKKDKGGTVSPAPVITAEEALIKVKAALPNLTVGKAFVKTGKRSDKKLETNLVLKGQIVSRLRLNPLTGEILHKGQKVSAQNVSASLEQAVNIARDAVSRFEIGSVRLSRHGAWVVDLTLNKVAVASIGVDGSNGAILEDIKASRDSTGY